MKEDRVQINVMPTIASNPTIKWNDANNKKFNIIDWDSMSLWTRFWYKAKGKIPLRIRIRLLSRLIPLKIYNRITRALEE